MAERPHPPLHARTVTRLLEDLQARRVSPVEIAEACRTRREQLDPVLRAFAQVDDDRAARDARQAEARRHGGRRTGELCGVPLAVKDDLPLAGWPLRRGSLTTDPAPVPSHAQAPSVTALLRQGMFVHGKTTLPEFGWKATTDSPLTGVTRNPWDPSRTAGGSSGGNAVALATGMSPAAIGTDIGGSVRIPASFCGVVGFKPTQTVMSGNADSKTGLLLSFGLMARTVEDVAQLMRAAKLADATRPRRPGDAEGVLERVDDTAAELRVGLSPGLGLARPDPAVEDQIDDAARIFVELGAEVEPCTVWEGGACSEIYEALYLPHLAHLVDAIPEALRDQLDPALLALADDGRAIPATRYVEALSERRRLIERMHQLHRHYDVILSATVPVLPFDADRNGPPDAQTDRWWRWTPLTLVFNLTGQPAMSVPCGRTPEGLPVGLQISGPHTRDDLVLNAGHVYQRAGYWPELAT